MASQPIRADFRALVAIHRRRVPVWMEMVLTQVSDDTESAVIG
jgi:hypothetical protein